MTRHIFKLVWNRKRSTGLILLELLICFLVLCAILSSVAHMVDLWRRPLGFTYENIWTAEIAGLNWRAEGEEFEMNRRGIADVLRVVKTLPEVESVALSTNLPYSQSQWSDGTWINGEQVGFMWNLATPELMDVLGLNLLHGRWIEATDDALSYQPVVLSKNLAHDIFDTENPLGRDVPIYDREGKLSEPEDDAKINRVVGVLDNVRRSGEFSEVDYAMWFALNLETAEELATDLLIRVRPGTTATFEESLVRAMQSVMPQWSYETALLEDTRHSRHMQHLGPILIATVVAVFLIIMVGLGLVGVLWLSVTRRTAELGLRRALGASALEVRSQILAELWALTAIAIAVGAIIFLQFPLFGANFGAGWPVFIVGSTAATVLIYGFVTVCGLYPTWLATRVQPATALQYE